jgi:glycine/D-amino acid oxidase-like deaminating enzyme
MKIAIIGAGFCGLAVAWHLLELYSSTGMTLSITLFDSKGIGQGASGTSAGLLHPYSGAHAKLNWRGKEGVSATKQLIRVAEQALGKSVAIESGILRLALKAVQEEDFRQCATLHPLDTKWIDAQKVQQIAPGCAHAPALWIPRGITVYSALYLQGLWEALVKRGVQLVKQKIHSLRDLSPFDQTVIATGAETTQIDELSKLPLSLIKGQVLELTWPTQLPPLPCPLNSQAYLVMTQGNRSCLVGSTYEKGYQIAEVDQKTAEKEILPKALALFPPLRESRVLSCSAGMRTAGPQHRPLIKQLSSSQWLLTGMGSKGLLYHALFAKELAQQILAVF